jgi:hypothetical protein
MGENGHGAQKVKGVCHLLRATLYASIRIIFQAK